MKCLPRKDPIISRTEPPLCPKFCESCWHLENNHVGRHELGLVSSESLIYSSHSGRHLTSAILYLQRAAWHFVLRGWCISQRVEASSAVTCSPPENTRSLSLLSPRSICLHLHAPDPHCARWRWRCKPYLSPTAFSHTYKLANADASKHRRKWVRAECYFIYSAPDLVLHYTFSAPKL
jgi:hypothetical protein